MSIIRRIGRRHRSRNHRLELWKQLRRVVRVVNRRPWTFERHTGLSLRQGQIKHQEPLGPGPCQNFYQQRMSPKSFLVLNLDAEPNHIIQQMQRTANTFQKERELVYLKKSGYLSSMRTNPSSIPHCTVTTVW
jgi:hypothetical protein